MNLTVLTEPNQTLRKKSEALLQGELKTIKFQKLIDDMIDTMKKEKGIGIAAPQVGINKRIIIIDQDKKGPTAFINPKIISESKKMTDSEEGCLSVPGTFGIVERHKKIKVKALDRDGEPVRLSTDGILAIVFQHEIDHLDGVLFIDKVERYTTPTNNSDLI